MDHIPYPAHLDVSPVIVPYLGGYEFDGGDFGSFDDRLGVESLTLSAHQYADLAQAWLYFGFLEEFTQTKINKQAFLRRPTSSEATITEYIVDSSPLQGILDACVKRQRRRMWYRDRARQERHWTRTLRIAQLRIQQLQYNLRWNTVECDEICGAVLLSVHVLEVTLRDFYFRMDFIWSQEAHNWGSYPRAMNKRMPGFTPVVSYKNPKYASAGAELLINRMTEQGWCPNQTKLFFDNVDFAVGYYLSSITRIEDATHEACTPQRCTAYNTNNATYVIKHIQNHCECGIVEASDQALTRIIAADAIPLIRIQRRPKGQWALGVVECKPNTEYTAISHVWIDGLGNPQANGLPNCQIERLADHLVQLRRSQESWLMRILRLLLRTSNDIPLVWMDTLSIPVKREHKHLREKAINGMSLIYAGAAQVLILDDELRRIDSKSEPTELLHARMLASKWNSRSWTLQEGALAQKCYFQFGDSARHLVFPEQQWVKSFFKLAWRALKNPWWFIVCVWEYVFLIRNSFWPRFLRNPAPSGFQTMTQYVQRSLHVLASTHFDLEIALEAIQFTGWNSRSFSGPTGFSSVRYKFERTWNMLGQRTTTYAEDLHVIIANLSGFSVSQIMEIGTPVERTKTILHRIGGFNIGMICNRYPRPQEAEDCADRWIPSFPAPDKLDGNVQLSVRPGGITFDKTKWEDTQALMILNAASWNQFWIKYSQPCQKKSCHCRRDETNEEARMSQPDVEQDAPENTLLQNQEYTQFTQREDAMAEWLQAWQPEEAVNDTDLRSSFDSQYSTNSKGEHIIYEWYHICCHPPQGDKLDRSRYKDQEACILLMPWKAIGPVTNLGGARLLKTGREQADKKVHFRYDCPLEYTVRWTAPSREMVNGEPIIHIKKEQELPSKNIIIENEVDPSIHTKYLVRDRAFFRRSPYFVATTLMFFIAPIVSYLTVVAISKMLNAIRHTKPPKTQKPRAKYANLGSFLITMALWIPLMTTIFLLVRREIRRRAFRAWKETLKDDWKPSETTKKWWFWNWGWRGKKKELASNEGFWEWVWKDRRAKSRARLANRRAQYELVSML